MCWFSGLKEELNESEDHLSIDLNLCGVLIFEEVEGGFFGLGFRYNIELSSLYEFDHVIGIDEGKDVWFM